MLLLVSFVSCEYSEKSNSSIETLNLKTKYGVFDFDIDGNKIYVADFNTIRVYDFKGNQTGVIGEDLNGCNILSVNNGIVYAIQQNEQSKKSILNIYNNNKLVNNWPLPEGLCINSIYLNGKLIILQESLQKKDERFITLINLKDGSHKKLSFEGLKTIAQYEDDSILVCTELNHNLELYLYDINKSSKSENTIDSTEYVPEFMYYDSKSVELIYSTTNLIKKKNYKDGIEKTLKTFNGSYFGEIHKHDNNYFVSVPTRGIIQLIPDKKYEDTSHYINIAAININPETNIKFKKVAELIKKINPLTEIKFNSYSNNTINLKTSLMSGENNIDLFYMHSTEADDYAQAGVFLDLTNYTDINQRFNEMFTGIKELYSFNGKLISVPGAIYPTAWTVNNDLLQKLSLSLPAKNWSWNDFYDYAKNTKVDLDGDGKIDTYCIGSMTDYPLFWYQYTATNLDVINKKVNYQTFEFIDQLEKYKEGKKSGLFYLVNSYQDTNLKNVLFIDSTINLDNNNVKYIAPPTLNGTNVNIVYNDIIAINKKSKKIDVAIDFVNLWLSDGVQSLYANGSFYNNINMYQSITSKTFQNIETFDLCNSILKISRKNVYQKDILDYASKIIDDYMDDKLSAEKVGAQIEEKFKMMIGE